MVHLISGMLYTLGMERDSTIGVGDWAASSAGKTAATCRTSTPFCSTITAFRCTCGWTWAAKRRNWRASWDRRAFSTRASSNCGIHFQPGIDLTPSYYANSFPAKMRDEYFKPVACGA